MPRLVMMEHPGKTRQVRLRTNEIKLGRASTNDIVLDLDQVSRLHACITVESAFVTLKDLGSRNGTYVNGLRIESQVLANGDSIRVGTCEMRFLAAHQEFTQVEALRLLTVPGSSIDLDAQRACQEISQAYALVNPWRSLASPGQRPCRDGKLNHAPQSSASRVRPLEEAAARAKVTRDQRPSGIKQRRNATW